MYDRGGTGHDTTVARGPGQVAEKVISDAVTSAKVYISRSVTRTTKNRNRRCVGLGSTRPATQTAHKAGFFAPFLAARGHGS